MNRKSLKKLTVPTQGGEKSLADTISGIENMDSGVPKVDKSSKQENNTFEITLYDGNGNFQDSFTGEGSRIKEAINTEMEERGLNQSPVGRSTLG